MALIYTHSTTPSSILQLYTYYIPFHQHHSLSLSCFFMLLITHTSLSHAKHTHNTLLYISLSNYRNPHSTHPPDFTTISYYTRKMAKQISCVNYIIPSILCILLFISTTSLGDDTPSTLFEGPFRFINDSYSYSNNRSSYGYILYSPVSFFCSTIIFHFYISSSPPLPN